MRYKINNIYLKPPNIVKTAIDSIIDFLSQEPVIKKIRCDTMRVAIFTGTISLQEENHDVRRLYITERLKYFSLTNVQLEVVTPQVNKSALPEGKNIKYNMYKLMKKKHLKLISVLINSSVKLKELDCKLIHCYTHHAAIVAWLINHTRKNKYLIIYEPMGLAYEESKLDQMHSVKVKILRPFIKFEETLAYKRSNAVAVYTNMLKNYVSKEFYIDAKKIYVIPHGINLKHPAMNNNTRKFSILNKLNIPQKNKIVLYAGSLSDLHGTPFLIEAIDIVNKKRQDVSFLVLGRGALEGKIKTFIKENQLTNTHLLGFVPQEEIEIYLSLADILVIPHAKCMQTELDQPTKLYEYLDSGKPIVSFNLKAIAEVVGNNAILVEPDSPKALADGILTLIEDEALCKKLGEKGKSIVEEYTWERSAEKQYELYKELYKNI